MIRLRDIISESTVIHNADKLYSGRLDYNDTFDEWRPAFFTKDISGAKFFATPSAFTKSSGTPTIIEANIMFKNPCDWELAEDIGMKLNITDNEVRKYTDNLNGPVDFLYVPRFLKELEKLGYDSYMDSDVLLEREIPIVVVWHKNQIKNIKYFKI
jgi:hypothetical protein